MRGALTVKEKKYCWRTAYDNKATDEENRLGKLEVRKGWNNSSYKVYVVENTEPYDLINTLQKMAQKRALVTVTLIVTSASDFFTQDVEDMVDVEFRECRESRSLHKILQRTLTLLWETVLLTLK